MQETKGPVTPEEFAKRIKEKYPQYADVEDSLLVDKILAKYPQYKDQVSFEKPTPEKKSPVESESVSISEDQQLDSKSPQESESTTSDSSVEPEPEKESFWENKWRELTTGSTSFGEILASVPEGLYRLAAGPQNLIAKATGIEELEASPEKFKETFDVTNPVLDYYREETDKLKAETKDYYTEKYGDDNMSPSDAIMDYQFGKAFELLAGSVLESLPTSVAMMAGGAAAGSVGKLAAYSTPAFIESSVEELKQHSPEEFKKMSEAEITAKALGMAGAETVFTAIGTGTLGKVYKDIITKEGKEKGVQIFKQGVEKFYETLLKRFGAPAAAIGEGAEEVATKVTQNMIKGAPAAEGVTDAFLQGVGGGITHGAPLSAVQAADYLNKKVAKRSVNKKISNSAKYTSPADLFREKNTYELDDTQISIAGRTHSRSVIESDLKKQVKEGKMTEKEAAQNLQLFDETASILQQMEGAELSEQQKVRAVNLIREKVRLKEKLKDKDKSLFKKDHERVKAINEELEAMSGTVKPKTKNDERKQEPKRETTTESDQEGTSGAEQEGADQGDLGNVGEPGTQEKGEVRHISTFLTKKVENEPHRDITEFEDRFDNPKVLELAKKAGVKVVFITEEMRENPLLNTEGGKYIGDGVILVNPEYVDRKYQGTNVIQHESAHAYTAAVLMDKTGDLTQQEQEFKDNIEEIFNSKKTFLNSEYGFRNTSEFVAEFLSNEEFRNKVKGQDLSFYDKIKNLIARFINKQTGLKTEDVIAKFENYLQGEGEVVVEGEVVAEDISIKQRSKEIADKIRSYKANQSINDAFNKFQSNPVGGLFTVAWDGALETAATTIELTGNTAQAVNDAMKAFVKSEYYKSLTTRNQRAAEKEFKKQLGKVFEPYEESKVKAKKEKPKTTIRKTTGQTDTSEKVTYTKKQLLKEQYMIASKAAREGYYARQKKAKDAAKAFKEVVNEISSKFPLSAAKTKQFIKKASDVATMNEKELNKLFDQIGKAAIRAEHGVKVGRLRKLRKTAKDNVKKHFGRYGESARILSNINLDNVPVGLFQEYYDVMQMLASKRNFDPKKADALVEAGIGEQYEAQVKEDYLNKLTEANKEEDKTKQVESLKEAFDNLDPKLSEFDKKGDEYKIVKNFLDIPRQWLYDNMNKAMLNQLTYSLEALNNGAILNKSMQTAVMMYDAKLTADEIKATVGDTFITPAENVFQSLRNKRKAKTKFETDDYRSAINDVMLRYIDSVLTRVKGLSFYKDVIHPLTANLNKSHEETNNVEKGLNKLINTALKSRGTKDGFDLGVLLQHYFRQKEFDSAKTEHKASKKVFSARQHLDAMLENRGQSGYSDASIDVIEEQFNRFAVDGEFSVEKAFNHFNKHERALVDYMYKELETTKSRNQDVNNHLRGETLEYFDSYFPRRNRSTAKDTFNDGVNVKDRMAAVLGSTSTKSGSSNFRKGKKAKPLNYDTFSTFMEHVKDTNIEYNLSYEVKRSGIILSQLKAHEDNNSLQMTANAIESGIKIMLENELSTNLYTPTSKIQQFFRYMVRRTFNRMLIDPIRMSYDAFSTYSTFYLAHADKIGEIRKAAGKYGPEFMTEMGRDFGSTHLSRIGGSRAVDFQVSEMSPLSKSSFKKADPSKGERFLDFMKKNKVSDKSDFLGKKYYDIVDGPAKQVWAWRFDQAYKDITGKEFSKDEYTNNKDYKIANEKAIKEAVTRADKSTTILFNTATKAEKKLKYQHNSSDVRKLIDSFMRSFPFNENKAFWESFHSLNPFTEKGDMTIEEAVRAQIIINGRSLTYAFLQQTILGMIVKLFVPQMEEDEELMERAGRRAIYQHAALLLAGNRGVVGNVALAFLIEKTREIIHEEDPMNEGDEYDYEDSALYTPPERGTLASYFGMFGAEGNSIRAVLEAGGLMNKYLDKALFSDEPITEEDFVKWKTTQIVVGTISQLFGAPINRLGVLAQDMLEASKE